MFQEIVGDEVYSDGIVWKEGVYPVEAFYNACLDLAKPISWPGMYAEKLEGDGTAAVDDWMMDLGLERVA